MSRTWLAVALVVCGLAGRAVAGWICDGVAEGGGGGGATVVTNSAVRVLDAGGTSVVYVVTDSGHTNVVGRFRSD